MHGEVPCSLQPAGFTAAPVEFQKGVAVAGGAVAEVRTLGERSGLPGEFTRCNKQIVNAGIGKTRKARHHARCTVAVLGQQRAAATSIPADRLWPVCLAFLERRGCAQGFFQAIRPVQLLAGREKGPAADDGEGVARKAMNRAEEGRHMAIEMLDPKIAAGFVDKLEPIPKRAG